MISKVLFKVEDGVEMELEVSANESLLDAAKKAGIAIDAPCSGNGTCGKCRVKVIRGKAESGNQRFISPDDYADGWRLACASQAESDLTVLVPASAGAYKNRIKITELQTARDKAAFEHLRGELRDMGYLGSVPGTQDSGIELLPLVLEQASLDDPLGDRERLLRGVSGEILADDSGLCVDALEGRPGIFSARYGERDGRKIDAGERNALLLEEMRDAGNRTARFVCSAVLLFDEYRFVTAQETVEGEIAREERGKGGFGYDPVFLLPKRGLTIAELPEYEKHRISNRGKAFRALAPFLGGGLADGAAG